MSFSKKKLFACALVWPFCISKETAPNIRGIFFMRTLLNPLWIWTLVCEGLTSPSLPPFPCNWTPPHPDSAHTDGILVHTRYPLHGTVCMHYALICTFISIPWILSTSRIRSSLPRTLPTNLLYLLSNGTEIEKEPLSTLPSLCSTSC